MRKASSVQSRQPQTEPGKVSEQWAADLEPHADDQRGTGAGQMQPTPRTVLGDSRGRSQCLTRVPTRFPEDCLCQGGGAGSQPALAPDRPQPARSHENCALPEPADRQESE